MTTLIEDSPRPNQAKWVGEAVKAGCASGAIMTPWATPWHHRGGPGKKPGLRERVDALRNDGVEVWFDATTHALQMGGAGDFRYYDEYDLWGGPRGDLGTPAYRGDHVRKVFEVQDAVGSVHVAPTVLLHTGLSHDSVLAFELAKQAVDRDPQCCLTVGGTASFWASGRDLDAHIGALSSLEPAGWFLVVARPLSTLPVAAVREEVHGLCRTTRALSEDAPIHISHGDLAGLPAVAAGAQTIGTGWDKRQRVQAFSDYAPRAPGNSGGAWYERATVRGLLGSLSSNEANVLRSRDPGLAGLLGGVPAPGPKEAFLHHARELSGIVRDIAIQPTPRERYERLCDLYDLAAGNWVRVQRQSPATTTSAEWIDALAAGLRDYGRSEGW